VDQESINVVLTALAAATAAGAGRGVQDAASDAVSSTYQALKNRLASLLGKNSKASEEVGDYLLNPAEHKSELAQELALIEGEPAAELVALAGQLRTRLSGSDSHVTVTAIGNRGVMFVDRTSDATQTNYFTDPLT